MIIGIMALPLPEVFAGKPTALPFSKNESITYAIKKMGVKAGEASLVFGGETEVQGQRAYLINFRASAFNFLDEEKIFLDTQNFLPIRVERNVVWGKKEKITEQYDQKKYEVRIVKTARGKTTEQVIKKDKPMENLYGFIYRYRKEGKFTAGDTLQMNLPTKEVTLKLVKKDKMKLDGKEQEIYFMESDPAQYKVWFDASDKKVPLKIDGAVGFGSTSMVMREYKSH